MAFVIAAPCVADYSCVEVCPVGCIAPGPDSAAYDAAEQLYINPDTCINCGACVEACPVSAIYKKELLPEKWVHYARINADYFSKASTADLIEEPKS